MELLVFALTITQAQPARPRSPSAAARAEDAYYALYGGPWDNAKHAARVAIAVGAISLYAGLLGILGPS